MAQIKDDPFLSPVQLIRISPIFRKDIPLAKGVLFINAGVDFLHFERNIELPAPYFRDFGYLRWNEIPRQFIVGFGYSYSIPGGFVIELENRIRVMHYAIMSTGLNIYW
ncbi:MAG: hypothetical protein AB8H47_04885 [Bacteroidia bacterium]